MTPGDRGSAAAGGGTPASRGAAAVADDDDKGTEHQRDAHNSLVSHGWQHEGTSSSGTHVYSHPDQPGRTMMVKPSGYWRNSGASEHKGPPWTGANPEQLARHLAGGATESGSTTFRPHNPQGRGPRIAYQNAPGHDPRGARG